MQVNPFGEFQVNDQMADALPRKELAFQKTLSSVQLYESQLRQGYQSNGFTVSEYHSNERTNNGDPM